MNFCSRCGTSLKGGRFCQSCGAAVAESLGAPGSGSIAASKDAIDVPGELRALLDTALRRYSQLFDQLAAEVITEEQFQSCALDTGAVRWRETLWLLDLDNGCWHWYDGLGLQSVAIDE